VSKCVLGICVQLLKTAGVDEKSSGRNSRKTLLGEGVVDAPLPLYVLELRLNECKLINSILTSTTL